MSSSNERILSTRSIVRNILITLLIAFPSGGGDLGKSGHEILPQQLVRKLERPLQRRVWTRDQLNQLRPQSQQERQLASLSVITANHGAEQPLVTESIDIWVDRVGELRERHLLLPLSGLSKNNLRDSFNEPRGNHIHEAIDILALRNTPIVAVENGSIARLWYSILGGITIYQFDPQKEYEYYYAHLESYAPGLKEGDPVRRGQVVGYVGTSGNAPKDTPHLHFTIFKLTDSKQWWKGTSVNPYLVFR